MDKLTFASYIDHTILKPNIQIADSFRIAKETAEYHFASACIPPSHVKSVAAKFPDITLCTVISFPFGYDETFVKLKSCENAIKDGAQELDIVVNISKIKSGDWDTISYEMQLLNDFIHSEDKLVKWIFENSYLTPQEIMNLCALCNQTNVDFAKTSTGFGEYGARIEDVKLMRENLNENIAIKASGGIRSLNEAMEFINEGAMRIGTSSGVQLMGEIL